MTGEGHLDRGREDAHLAGMTGLGRKHECALGEVELPGDLLHLPVRESAGLGQHRQLIAAEAGVGEDVADEVAVAHGRLILLPVTPW